MDFEIKREDYRLAPLCGCFRVTSGAKLPEYATEKSACFDIFSDFTDGAMVSVYSSNNNRSYVKVNNGLLLRPGERALIPTGIVFDIPKDMSLRIHPRSGSALKHGITLTNAEGVIDEDYIVETFVILHNTSSEEFKIQHNQAIAQGELVERHEVSFEEIFNAPLPKSSRNGGFGSTDKSK